LQEELSLRDKYPDNYALSEDNLKSIDEKLLLLPDLKFKYDFQLECFRMHFSEDLQSALIIRLLEKNGKPTLPETEVINTFFEIIENIVVLTLEMIGEEYIRL